MRTSMEREFKIGDKIICKESGVIGICTKFYIPTACEEQTMVETSDGRFYHAPTRTWKRYDGLLYGDDTIICAVMPRNCGKMVAVEALTEVFQKTHKHGLLKRMVKKSENH